MYSQKRKNRGRYIATIVAVLTAIFFLNTLQQAWAQSQRKNEIKKEENYNRPVPTRPIRPEIPGANRYQEDKVFLEYADSLFKVRTWDTIERQILKGNVKFRQSGMWMYCDSAYYYPEANSLDAYSNVRMEQGDTLFVYADNLYYDGNARMAYLKNGPSQDKVIMINKDVTLTTDSLDYNLEIDLGWYSRWGTIDDKVNTLTSLYGEYSPATKQAEFYKDVVLVNNKDGYTMYTDTLHYNTATHIANIDSKTEIRGANDTIYTNLATYYTDTGNADLLTRSLIIHRDSAGNVTTLEGDSIIYDNATRTSRVFMFRDPYKRSYPMELRDTAQKTTLIGGFGIYNDSTKEALATIYPLLMEYSQGDTLFLRADTIKTYIITEMRPSGRRKIRTESGYPESEGKPIVIVDSTGYLWIDTLYFKVRNHYVEAPLKMLLSVLPKKEEVKEQNDSISSKQESIEIISFNDSLTKKGDIITLQDESITDIPKESIKDRLSLNDSIPKKISGNDSTIFNKDSISIEIPENPQDTLGIESVEIDLSQDTIPLKIQMVFEENDSISLTSLREIFEENDTIALETLQSLVDRNDSISLPEVRKVIEENDTVAILKFVKTLRTLKTANDTTSTISEEPIEEEVKEEEDSIPFQFHVALAYHRGRFFKQDMQGVADSIVFIEKDSMLYLFRKPIVWSGERQVTGNRIDVHFNDSTTDWAYLPEYGLISEYVDEDFYNQISGKEIKAYFDGDELRRMTVSGNVETIFLPQEADSTYNRLVTAESSYLELYLKNNQMDWLKMWPEVSGTVTPIFLVKKNQQYLQRFRWWGFLRPQREWYGDKMRWADDLGEVPDELEQYFLSPSDFGEPQTFSGTRVVLPPTSISPVMLQTGEDSEGVKDAEETLTIEDIENEEEVIEEEKAETDLEVEEIEKALEEEESENGEIISMTSENSDELSIKSEENAIENKEGEETNTEVRTEIQEEDNNE